MSNVATFTQVDRAREAALRQQEEAERRRREEVQRERAAQQERIRQAQDQARARAEARRRAREQARQEREQAQVESRRQQDTARREAQAARQRHQQDAASRRQAEAERQRQMEAIAEQRRLHEEAEERRQAEALEAQQRRLAEETRLQAELERRTLRRAAMNWKDLGLVVRLAEKRGYRVLPAQPMQDGRGSQPVTVLLAGQGLPTVGLIRHERGVEIVSHGPDLVRQIVQPLAQEYALEKALVAVRARGFEPEVVRGAGGELRVTARRIRMSGRAR